MCVCSPLLLSHPLSIIIGSHVLLWTYVQRHSHVKHVPVLSRRKVDESEINTNEERLKQCKSIIVFSVAIASLEIY
jgi:hypothetical protein